MNKMLLKSAAVAFCGLVPFAAQAQLGAWVGKRIPDFIMTTIDGRKVTRNDLRGKVVLFDFWATWCGPCKAASPAMQKLYSHYASKGVLIIGADVMENTPGPQGARGYKAEHKFSYLFTYNNDGLAQTLGINNIPAFALLDRSGVIRNAKLGIPRGGGTEALYAYFSGEIDKLLSKSAGSR